MQVLQILHQNSSSLSSPSDAAAFIGFWQLVCIHLQNSEQARLNLTHEQSAVLHPVLQPKLTMLSKTREEGQSGPLLCTGNAPTHSAAMSMSAQSG